MHFQIKDVLQAAAPSASLAFAAWIFLSFLQQRYVSAFQTFRTLVDAYRTGDLQDARRQALESQVRLYRRRCDWMRWATNIGLLSALCFIATLLGGVVGVVWPELPGLNVAGAITCGMGFALVAIAAVLTLLENTASAAALDDEVRDLHQLMRS